MGMAEVISGIVKGVVDSGYSIYQDQRDYWQQKATQDKMWRREDNAVQRRVADLEKAGLNKNLAAGSSAGAGPVVSRSSSKNVEFGSVLDVLQQAELLKRQRYDTERAQSEAEIAKNAKAVSDLEKDNAKRDYRLSAFTNAAETINLMYQLGLEPQLYYGLDSYNRPDFQIVSNAKMDENSKYIDFSNSPIMTQLRNHYNNDQNTSSILQYQKGLIEKQYENYDTDKTFERVGNIISDIASGGGLVNSIFNTANRAKNANKPRQKVVEQFKKRGYNRTESY